MNTNRTTLAALLAALATASAQEPAPAPVVKPLPPARLHPAEPREPGEPTHAEAAVSVFSSGGEGEGNVVIAVDGDHVANPMRWQYRLDGDDQAMPLSPREGPIGYLGVSTVLPGPEVAAQLPIPPDTGLVVAALTKDSAADKAGLERNDVLVRLDDQILIHPRQFAVLVANHKPGDTVKLTLLRKGKQQEITATLDKRELPKNPPAQARTFRFEGRDGGGGPSITIDGQPVEPLRTFTKRLQAGDDLDPQIREIRERVEQLAKQRLELHSPEMRKPAENAEARVRELQERIEQLTRELEAKEKK
ncbi:PDZ domain-containing protein [Luteolibacter sp. LG18]|uniref:PDZ domain-containing protein n=1 Tax=Luteolibacter sp. LG18 TaxID=2819286 RepID=UPI002B285C68|nr:hypothetical protein llg_26430 [Luteolibacter sp. LG18]